MSKRYEKFDILRGIAIIGVMFIHITASPVYQGDVFSIVLNQIARFAVPVFIFLSGWGLTISDSLERSDNYWDFLKVRFLGIIPQYLIWNVIYLIYSDIWETSVDLTFAELLQEILLGTIYNHLYFVPVILVFYIAYPLLLKMSNRWGVLFTLFVTLASQISDVWFEHAYFYMNKNIFNWLFYFVLGIWMAKHFGRMINKVQNYKPSITITTVISMVGVILTPFLLGDFFEYNLAIASTRPSVIFYSVMVILLAMIIPFNVKFLNKIFLKLGQYSFYIYLNHYLFVNWTRDLYTYFNLDLSAPVFIVLSFLLITVASLMVAAGTKKLEDKVVTLF